jgi:CHASE2 domain-containing sensor protein
MLYFIRTRFRSKPVFYWSKTAGAILLGTWLGAVASEHHLGLPWRYEISRIVQRLQPRQQARSTTIVVIEDDEYWRGRLARRVPIHRDYLATLVTTVARCDPSVIALDFNFRSPVVTGDLLDRFGTLRDNRDYTGETAQLVAVIGALHGRPKIVLPVTISQDGAFVEPSVLDAVPDAPGAVVRGNINLPFDYRQVPTSETIGSRRVLSFALAAASLGSPKLLTQFPPDEFPYDLTFVAAPDFDKVSYREDASFPTADECQKMWHKIVVVGSGWQTGAYKVGDVIDTRKSTPMGPSVGAVYLHANYIEALLQGRARGLLPPAVAFAIEIGATCLIAFILAGGGTRLRNYAAAAAIALLLLFLTYICAQNLGLYAEFFFPAVFVFLHARWDDWRELRAAAATQGVTAARLIEAEAEMQRLRAAAEPAPLGAPTYGSDPQGPRERTKT